MPPNCSRRGLLLHHLADDFDHLGQTFHREVFALDRHEHFGRAGQGRAGQLAQRRRAIDQHEIVGAQAAGQMLPQGGGVACRAGQRFDILKVAAARQQFETGDIRSPAAIPAAALARPADAARPACAPRPLVALHCGSRSTSNVREPAKRQPDGQVDRRWSSCRRPLSDWQCTESDPRWNSISACGSIRDHMLLRTLRGCDCNELIEGSECRLVCRFT